MRILWITNTIFPAPSKALGIPPPVIGGWMYGLLSQFASVAWIRLAVATTYRGNDLKSFDIGGVLYYLLPFHTTTGYPKKLEPFWQKVCADFQPEVIHIHGTEYTHGLACMRACSLLNYVVSIQGLVSICARYYYAGISASEIFKNITLRDIIQRDTLFQGKKKFVKKGLFEKEYIQRTKHVIGRTDWDYAHTKSLNPSVNYHFCNEILRDIFYTSPKWNSTCKTDYMIFLSQAVYPLKGLHQTLKAVALLKKDFPNIKIKVAGRNIINTTTLIDKIKLRGYGAYIRKLIKQLNLHDQVQFTGPLTEDKMVAEYLNAHLFICPSSIENCSNSVGEAQLLGVPTIASYTGGLPTMIVHGETGMLYRFEEIEMLAEHIRLIFTDTTLTRYFSEKSIIAAEKRHNQITNLNQMIDIYCSMMK